MSRRGNSAPAEEKDAVKNNKGSDQKAVKSRKAIEGSATFGLILVAVGLAAPFTDLMNTDFLRIFKWVYAAGALLFTIARIVGANDPDDSMRVRRLRRMEFWAGVALCIGAFFWFYNENRFAEVLSFGFGTNACLQETIYFTLVGAIIQVICSLSITRRLRKEAQADTDKKKKK